jgi:hypothetical protein
MYFSPRMDGGGVDYERELGIKTQRIRELEVSNSYTQYRL